MTTEVAVRVDDTDEQERRRKVTLLKAVGLDRASPEQRELALAIAKRYDLDLLLKHLVLVDGRPYVTRDALLHIAHRSGQLDGIEVTEPVLADGFWRASCSVYRKDMNRPFTYSGRYPEKGGNAKFAPEMATKVAESMALRRAFDISAPSQDERWDAEIPQSEPVTRPSLADLAAQRAETVRVTAGVAHWVPTPAQIEDGAATDVPTTGRSVDSASGTREGEANKAASDGAVVTAGSDATPPASGPAVPNESGDGDLLSVSGGARQQGGASSLDALRCAGFDVQLGRCVRESGHTANHRTKDGESWK